MFAAAHYGFMEWVYLLLSADKIYYWADRKLSADIMPIGQIKGYRPALIGRIIGYQDIYQYISMYRYLYRQMQNKTLSVEHYNRLTG